MCKHVYLFECICVCMYMCMLTCMYVHTYARVSIHVRMRVCTYDILCVFAWMCAPAFVKRTHEACDLHIARVPCLELCLQLEKQPSPVQSHQQHLQQLPPLLLFPPACMYCYMRAKTKGGREGEWRGPGRRVGSSPKSDSDLNTDTSIDIEMAHLITSLSFHHQHSSNIKLQCVMHQRNSNEYKCR